MQTELLKKFLYLFGYFSIININLPAPTHHYTHNPYSLDQSQTTSWADEMELDNPTKSRFNWTDLIEALKVTDLENKNIDSQEQSDFFEKEELLRESLKSKEKKDQQNILQHLEQDKEQITALDLESDIREKTNTEEETIFNLIERAYKLEKQQIINWNLAKIKEQNKILSKEQQSRERIQKASQSEIEILKKQINKSIDADKEQKRRLQQLLTTEQKKRSQLITYEQEKFDELEKLHKSQNQQLKNRAKRLKTDINLMDDETLDKVLRGYNPEKEKSKLDPKIHPSPLSLIYINNIEIGLLFSSLFQKQKSDGIQILKSLEKIHKKMVENPLSLDFNPQTYFNIYDMYDLSAFFLLYSNAKLNYFNSEKSVSELDLRVVVAAFNLGIIIVNDEKLNTLTSFASIYQNQPIFQKYLNNLPILEYLEFLIEIINTTITFKNFCGSLNFVQCFHSLTPPFRFNYFTCIQYLNAQKVSSAHMLSTPGQMALASYFLSQNYICYQINEKLRQKELWLVPRETIDMGVGSKHDLTQIAANVGRLTESKPFEFIKPISHPGKTLTTMLSKKTLLFIKFCKNFHENLVEQLPTKSVFSTLI